MTREAIDMAISALSIPMFKESAEAYKEWTDEDMGATENSCDLISRAEAIKAIVSWESEVADNVPYAREVFEIMAKREHEILNAIERVPSVSAEPIFTEEVRKALMRLTMCAREECGMCKYKDDCDFDKQYEMATDNMHTILNAFKCVSAEPSDLVSVIRCKDCKHRYSYTNGTKQYCLCDFMDALYDADGFCHHGERKG